MLLVAARVKTVLRRLKPLALFCADVVAKATTYNAKANSTAESKSTTPA